MLLGAPAILPSHVHMCTQGRMPAPLTCWYQRGPCKNQREKLSAMRKQSTKGLCPAFQHGDTIWDVRKVTPQTQVYVSYSGLAVDKAKVTTCSM